MISAYIQAATLITLSNHLHSERWKVINGDDESFMSMCLIATDDAPDEMVYCSRDPNDEYDASKVVAATSIQSPEYVFGGVDWYERAKFITYAHNHAPDIAQRLLDALDFIEYISRVDHYDPQWYREQACDFMKRVEGDEV